ncbi:MAG: transporter substrate-binding domain-containing protein [Ilumatobacteraceae bacterium]
MTTRQRRGRPSLLGAVALLAAGVLAPACSSARSDALDSLDELPRPPATEPSAAEPAPTTTPAQHECEVEQWATKSYRPRPTHGAPTDDPFVDAIIRRGHLRVGVDENTLGFAALNPETGDIEGFEVALAHEIAARIFPDADTVERIVTVPVVTSTKFESVESGTVDLTISANTMSCRRWDDVAFSAEYYTARQEFLVRADSDIHERDDLAGRTVCVTAASTSAAILAAHVPDAERREVADRTGCLVALQEGEVDAYFGHDSFLYGMLVQDPNVEIRSGILPAEAGIVSHYGIAIARDQVEFVRFVNGVLRDVTADGTWDRLHDELAAEVPDVPPASAPEPEYRD